MAEGGTIDGRRRGNREESSAMILCCDDHTSYHIYIVIYGVFVFSSHLFWTSSSLDVPAGVTHPSYRDSNSHPNASKGYEVTN